MRKIKFAFAAIVICCIAVWLNNTSKFIETDPSHSFSFIAHRGAHQIYAGSERSRDTCRAEHIEPLEHPYIENTLPSIRAAGAAGAPIVEIDVHLTTDKVFAVFHDWRLDCQTNGSGVTHKQKYTYLKTLDVGFGFTADGDSYPLRGLGEGMIPSLTQLLDEEIGVRYLVNFKSNRRIEGEELTSLLSKDTYRKQIYGVYGGEEPTRAALAGIPGLRGFDKSSVKACLKAYLLTGWTGKVPAACHHTMVAIPIDYADFLWGWPHKFTQRMQSVGTDVILVAPWDGSGFTSGFDDETTLSDIPGGFSGYVWTNRILSANKLLKQSNVIAKEQPGRLNETAH